MGRITKRKKGDQIISDHLPQGTGVGGFLRFTTAPWAGDMRALCPLGMLANSLFLCAFTLSLLVFSFPAVAADLPISVSTSVASPGETITITGEGFQSGAQGLVWGGGPYVSGSVNTLGDARDVVISGGYAYVADGSNGLQVVDVSNPAVPTIVGSVDTPGLAWDVIV